MVEMESSGTNEAFRPPPEGISPLLEAQAISRLTKPAIRLLRMLVALLDTSNMEEDDEGQSTRRVMFHGDFNNHPHSFFPLSNLQW